MQNSSNLDVKNLDVKNETLPVNFDINYGSHIK